MDCKLYSTLPTNLSSDLVPCQKKWALLTCSNYTCTHAVAPLSLLTFCTSSFNHGHALTLYVHWAAQQVLISAHVQNRDDSISWGQRETRSFPAQVTILAYCSRVSLTLSSLCGPRMRFYSISTYKHMETTMSDIFSKRNGWHFPLHHLKLEFSCLIV